MIWLMFALGALSGAALVVIALSVWIIVSARMASRQPSPTPSKFRAAGLRL